MAAQRLARMCVALTLTICMATSAAGQLSADTTYSDPSGRFSFYLPDGWSVTTPPNDPHNAVEAMDPSDGDSFTVRGLLIEGKSLAQIVSEERSRAKLSPDYQADPAGIQDVTVGKAPAKSFAYAWMDSGTTRFVREFLVMKQGTPYALIFATTADNVDAFTPRANTVLNSWQFL